MRELEAVNGFIRILNLIENIKTPDDE